MDDKRKRVVSIHCLKITLVALLLVTIVSVVAQEPKYYIGERLELYLINGTEGSPITTATCRLNITNYANNMILQNVDMSHLGHGRYNWTINNSLAASIEYPYLARAVCDVGTQEWNSYYLFYVVDNKSVADIDSLYYRMRNFIISWFSTEVTNQTCIDENTLRIYKVTTFEIHGDTVEYLNVTKHQDITCQYGCNLATNSCYGDPMYNFAIVIGVLVVAAIIYEAYRRLK